MSERESVITHLMIVETWTEYALKVGRNCFEKSHIKSICEWTGEALELLKEQEPVKPQIGGNPDYTWWYICPKCQLSIDKNDRFCRYCGRRLDWDA